MCNELEFAKGVYAAVSELYYYISYDCTIHSEFTRVMRQLGYHEIRINELYEQCKSE